MGSSTESTRQNPHFVQGKEVSVIYDDGRHYIRTLPEDAKFDVITSDPIDPWVKGSAALNTVEYYEMCKRHLKPGGVMSLWMPLYESNLASAKSMIATFFQVFPHGLIFSNDDHFEGYDAVLLGQAEPSPIQLDGLQRTAGTPGLRPGPDLVNAKWALAPGTLDGRTPIRTSLSACSPRLPARASAHERVDTEAHRSIATAT